MGKLLDGVVEYVIIRARQRGMGNNRVWVGVWVGITAARQLHRMIGKEATRTERIVLRPGQTVMIRDTGEPWGKAKKR